MFDKSFIKDNVSRLKEITKILSRYGFDYLVDKFNLPRTFLKEKKLIHLTRGQKIRLIFQELGSTFIKFGQALSCHPDLIPQDIIRELEKLQDKVEPFNFVYVEKAFLKTFKKPVEEIFKEFNPIPFASASIAQVHKATLLSGLEVVVKVQRPELGKKIKQDLDLLYFFAFLFEKHFPELKRYEISKLIYEFDKSIKKEIDFRLEANNLEKFRNNFKEIESVYFPKVYEQYSNQYILTMEHIYGAKIDTVIREKNIHNRFLVAQRGVSAIYKQIFEDGFFHADPHGGNLIVMKNDVVCFLDAGMVGVLNDDTKNLLANILIAVANKNINNLVSLFLNEGMVQDNCDILSFKEDLEDVFEIYYGVSLEKINLSTVLNKFMNLIFKYQVRLPHNFTLLIRCLIILEGVGAQIEPEYNPISTMIPYAKELMKKQYNPLKIADDIGQFLKDNLFLIRSLPNDITLFLQKFLKGKTEIKLDHQGLENLNQTIDKASSRLTAAVIIAGAVVASALIVNSHIDSIFIFGIFGYILSIIAAIFILIDVLKDINN